MTTLRNQELDSLGERNIRSMTRQGGDGPVTRQPGLKGPGFAATPAAMDVHPLIHHVPDPDHPGWWTWDVAAADRFNGVIGKLLVRPDGPGRATCRMFPEERHANLGDMIHGGAILTFVDMALFAGGRLAGAEVIRAVTLDLSTRFLSRGRIGVPLDAEVVLLRETKRLAFFAGKVVQDGELVAAFSGALRKSSKAVR
jgi:acyl-coenzyme A thioesterase PaaI-like protein